ncbi:YajG family lipoprotein [Noviherbaspirillum aerium]|uniref:hypothetical protein n=1 Tax=Noviherbaspirillum aerium TaxID=2588497 RepID=UPI00124F3388|nr:hypothetical protein [Noviherbaspirillum aerium]
MTSRRAFTTAMALACATLAGCASDRVSGVSTTPREIPAKARQAITCPFHIAAIKDLRSSDDLGSVMRTQVDGRDFLRWFTEGLAAMPGHNRDSAPVSLRIEVNKAYIQGLAQLLSANILVKVYASGSGGIATEKMYRGVGSNANWWNSEAEIQAVFEAALHDLQRQIGTDIQELCRR